MTKKHLTKWVAIPLLTSMAFAGVAPMAHPVSTVHAEASLETQANNYASEVVKFLNGLDSYTEKVDKAKTASESKKAVEDLLTYLYQKHPSSYMITPKYGKNIGDIHAKLDDFVVSTYNMFGAVQKGFDKTITEKELTAIVKKETENSFAYGVQYSELLAKYIEKNKINASDDLYYLSYGTERAKATTTHTVKKGDTLYSLAKTYKTTVADLKKLNNLKNDNLKVGQKLAVKATAPVVMPPKEEAKPVTGKTAKVTAGSLNVRSSASTKGKVVGTLKKGNALTVISVSGKWAKISYGKVTGFVHTDYVKMETVTKTPAKPAVPTTSKTHVVVKNDTLYSISKKYNVSVSTLKSLNNLKKDTIGLGQKLIIKK